MSEPERGVAVVHATIADEPALRRLLELYAYDFSELNDGDVDEHGVYGYQHLDAYWVDPQRHPFLIRVEGRIAGFALVRSGAPHDMAEFFVMRKYRRGGVGLQAARTVFGLFPGDWQVRELTANASAIAFWRRSIPAPFTEESGDEGPVQHFRIDAL